MKIIVKDIKKLFPQNTIKHDDGFIFSGITQDTRQLQKNEIYVAIKGENFDGHDFIEEAFKKGAAAVISENKNCKFDNVIFCHNTIQALAQLAHVFRQKLSCPVIAITGSSGKTTTKEWLRHILMAQGLVSATTGNLNNHIGLPLTLLRTNDDSDFVILEMGMSHSGEMAKLSEIAEPDIALITNIGPAHLENFDGKLENIALAKGELFAGLKGKDWAVVNHDDRLIVSLSTKAQKITYGVHPQAQIQAKNVQVTKTKTTFDLSDGNQIYPVCLRLVGKHHVSNALACYAIGKILKLKPERILLGLESFTLTLNRGRFIQHKNLKLIDDTYNANPDSMKAALESFAAQFSEQKKIAVLGDMLELGSQAAAYHLEIGKKIKSLGFHDVYALGPLSQNYLLGFQGANNRHFETHEDLAHALKQSLRNEKENVALLFKGSRGMQMEKVLQNILTGF